MQQASTVCAGHPQEHAGKGRAPRPLRDLFKATACTTHAPTRKPLGSCHCSVLEDACSDALAPGHFSCSDALARSSDACSDALARTLAQTPLLGRLRSVLRRSRSDAFSDALARTLAQTLSLGRYLAKTLSLGRTSTYNYQQQLTLALPT